jgi:bisphosphoglycerate-dependent phosphoglycerate mutase
MPSNQTPGTQSITPVYDRAKVRFSITEPKKKKQYRSTEREALQGRKFGTSHGKFGAGTMEKFEERAVSAWRRFVGKMLDKITTSSGSPTL